jgi:aminodeoxyfutalosine synthase
MVAGVRSLDPLVHIKAFTASEIVHFAELEGLTEEQILLDLKAAGLGSLPGGGAEILSGRVRQEVCPQKISGEKWLAVHRLAHGLGLKTNATILYGHVESHEDRVDHLLRLRAVQDETGGFQAFIPLAFQPTNTELSHLQPTTGTDDLKMMAVSRLLLDNFDNIKTYWVMTGLKLAQIALFFGANDMDGTVVEEVISLLSGASHGQAMPKDDLIRVIRDSGRVPVERDALYNVVRRYDAPVAGDALFDAAPASGAATKSPGAAQ